MTALISHICALARPQNEPRYRRYLATLTEPALKQKLTDLLLDDAKAQPVRFWRPSVTPARSGALMDRRELITI